MKYFNPNVVRFLKSLSIKDRRMFLHLIINKNMLMKDISNLAISMLMHSTIFLFSLDWAYIHRKACKYDKKYENSM